MPGPRTDEETDPSLNHPLTMSYMGAGSGREKGWGAGIFCPSVPGGGSRPEGRGVGSSAMCHSRVSYATLSFSRHDSVVEPIVA